MNGANFTDGLDGLAASVTVTDRPPFLRRPPSGPAQGLNRLPVRWRERFWGSFCLTYTLRACSWGIRVPLRWGGFVAASAYMMRMQLFIPIISFIYLVEVVSVILQVAYFKLTGGKRLFRMAPLHHHFELCGWSETRMSRCSQFSRRFCAWWPWLRSETQIRRLPVIFKI